MNKQTHPTHFKQIQTDGCYFMVDLSIGEDAGFRSGMLIKQFSPTEINLAYQYAIPDFMKSGRDIRKNRCYILSHEELIGIGLRLAGFRYFEVEYKYRKDGDEFKIGNESQLLVCNYFVKEVLIGKGPKTHFIRCNQKGITLYNPGISDSKSWVSFRGYLVKILKR
jgi:hypothetical protein